jgi:acyl-CoA thioester hydrolase
MGQWYETYRAVVFPWHCDHIGHMNVRWYAHHFDDAGFHLWSMAGVSHADIRAHDVGVVVAQIKIDYIKEMNAGDLLVVRNAFTHVGNKSIRHLGRMFNADTGVLCATQETIEVFFDPVKRVSAPMPDTLRQRLSAQVVDPAQD